MRYFDVAPGFSGQARRGWDQRRTRLGYPGYHMYLLIRIVDGDEPDWVLEHAKTEKRGALMEQWAEKEARLRSIREKELRQKQRYENGESRIKRAVSFATTGGRTCCSN